MPFQQPSDSFLRDTKWDLVVIGRGVSAIVNCMTRQLCDELPEKTLLVGLPDPWRRYANHLMGQHSALLSMPGFPEDAQTRDEPLDQFLPSRVFARNNRLQLLRLLKNGLFQVTCTVEDAFEFVQGRWLLPLVRQGECVTISSNKVDVCAGPGPGRVFQPGSGRVFGPWSDGIRDCFETGLLQQLRDNSGKTAMIGERFMGLHTTKGRVLVVGEGPLSASVVEHALNIGAEYVTWVGRPVEMAQISFPSSTRYDNHIINAPAVREIYRSWSTEINAGKQPNIQDVVQHMTPSSKRLVILFGIVSGVKTSSATIIGMPRLGVFDLQATKQDRHPVHTPITTYFDTLVVSASSENTDSERRSAAHLLRSIPKTASPDAPLVPLEKGGMFVGLQVPDGSLRVLGAASRNRSLLQKSSCMAFPCEIAYQEWCDSLSPQTQMPDYAMGITVAAATIATANEFYKDTKPDMCAQTTTLPDGPLAHHRRSTPAAILDINPYLGSYDVFPRTM